MQRYIAEVTRRAAAAKSEIAHATPEQKNRALREIAQQILASKDMLREKNGQDLEAGREHGLDAALLDRLELTDERIRAMAEGLEQVALLPDPVGEKTPMEARPSGIRVGKMRVAIGVILIIYESRPNVTADAAALCLKSGNAAILRGGSEALHSNHAIASCIHAGLDGAGIVQGHRPGDRDAGPRGGRGAAARPTGHRHRHSPRRQGPHRADHA